MTTKVIVDAHAGWPVEVTTIQVDNDGHPVSTNSPLPKTIVPPNTKQDFYIHSHSEIHIKELPNG